MISKSNIHFTACCIIINIYQYLKEGVAVLQSDNTSEKGINKKEERHIHENERRRGAMDVYINRRQWQRSGGGDRGEEEEEWLFSSCVSEEILNK